VSRVLVCVKRLLLTLVNGEVVDTLSADPFSVLFEVTYLDENDGWRFGEPRPEIGALETEIYSPMETIEIVQLHLPVSGTVPSIAEDLVAVREEEDPPRMETREPVLENERSHENTSHRETEEAVRTTGEVHFGSEESVDGPTIPFPVLGVIAESADEPTNPSPTIQLERNRSGLAADQSDDEGTPTSAESMEIAELKEFDPLVDCQLDTAKDYLKPTTGSTS